MDLLKEIRDRIKANPGGEDARGLKSVLTHIEIAERHYFRAKSERDEHLFTDVIYRTNHAYEGILKEAYVILAERAADRVSPAAIEDYLLNSAKLRSRFTDLLTNYRRNWRNPSTHDYQLFFSEQESFLAIVTVSAFASILLDHILEKIAYTQKSRELENAALLARDHIKGFAALAPIDKVTQILLSYGSYYLKHFETMSKYSRRSANAQLAAFMEKVAPEISLVREQEFNIDELRVQFDLVATVDERTVVIETRDPRSPDEILMGDDAAIMQLSRHLTVIGLEDGVVFFYPKQPDEEMVSAHSSSMWPQHLRLREVFSDDPSHYEFETDENEEPPVDLVFDRIAREGELK